MINLEILPAEESNPHKDVFVLTCTAMFGDADGYESIKMGAFKNDPAGFAEIEDGIRTCERMAAKYPYGAGGDASYSDVEGFSKWFHEGDDWPRDPFTDYNILAVYDSYEVAYYDNDGAKHPVKVTLS